MLVQWEIHPSSSNVTNYSVLMKALCAWDLGQPKSLPAVATCSSVDLSKTLIPQLSEVASNSAQSLLSFFTTKPWLFFKYLKKKKIVSVFIENQWMNLGFCQFFRTSNIHFSFEDVSALALLLLPLRFLQGIWTEMNIFSCFLIKSKCQVNFQATRS